MLSAYVNGKKVEARIYPKREFASFTNAQRAKIIELYNKRKETGKQLQSSQRSGTRVRACHQWNSLQIQFQQQLLQG